MIATLVSPRLRVAPLCDGDEALYVALYSDAATMRHIVPAQTPEAARRGFAAALRANAAAAPVRRFWALHRHDDGTPVGLLGLDHDAPGEGEVGAVIPAAHQGRGYAHEAIAALATHAFGELGLQRLHTRHDDDHAAAAALMAGLGFERTAHAAGTHGWRWQLTPARWDGGNGAVKRPIG